MLWAKVFATPQHLHCATVVDPMQQPSSATLRNSEIASTPSGVLTQIINPRRIVMNFTADQREQVASELKCFETST